MTPMILWMFVLVGAVALDLPRALMGPHSTDRAVSVDVLTTAGSGFLVIWAALRGNALLLDVSLVYTVLAFISVMAVARYLERGV